jgi:hypothetical protein
MRANMSIRLIAAVAAVAAVAALTACHGQQVDSNHVSPTDAIFSIHTNVRDAALWVDGKFVSSLDALPGGIAMGAGHHRIELRHDDYFSNYLDLDAKRAQRGTLDLQLAPILP